MPKKFIQHLIPDPRKLLAGRSLRIFGGLIHNANLWHVNRRSASGAFAIGFFVAFIPLPFHMLIAISLAIGLRVNVPLSAALVWVSNPVTMGPMMYANYKVGAFLLNVTPQPLRFELTLAWFRDGMLSVMPPLLLGSVVLGSIAALLAYTTIRQLWRQAVRNAWRDRARNRTAEHRASTTGVEPSPAQPEQPGKPDKL